MKDPSLGEKEKEKLYRDLVGRLKMAESQRKKEMVGLLKEISLQDLNGRTRMDELPSVLEKDSRFWAVPRTTREELVEAHIVSLPDR